MTLVNHLRFGLQTIQYSRWQSLKKQRPAKLRREFFPSQDLPGLHVVDSAWGPVIVEARSGDGIWFAGTPDETGLGAATAHRKGVMIIAGEPGTHSVSVPGLGVHQIRVARQNYEGRALFRALAEDDGA
jgi:hypothetical protein